MDRRIFIKNSSIAGISATLGFASSCNQPIESQKIEKNKSLDSFELNEVTVDVLQEKMKSGIYTSRSITQLYLNRIEKIDRSGPHINAIIELNPDALAIADAMDAERKAGKIRGHLHGIPVLIKDNINTADKMQTTAGSLALEGNIAKEDAFIIARLREAGAVLLGKTNLSEWANFRSTNSCSGWSSRGGQTKNPYILDHNPCGSSAGSGAAVAANLCAVAIGTETDGSITCPASVNNIVGIKPTVGLLSRSGIIPISSTQDTAGPMARTVKDAAIMLGALTGVDVDDAITNESAGKLYNDYTPFLDANALKGKKIGVDLKKKSSNQNLNRILSEAIDLMKSQGAIIIEIDYMSKFVELGRYEYEILQTEFKDGVNKYLSGLSLPIKALSDVIKFNKDNEDKAMPYFKQEQLENCENTKGINNPSYQKALVKGRDGARNIINEVMAKHQLDAIIGITMGPACSIDMVYGDRWGEDSLTQPAAMSGYPHISVPAGMAYRLPIGLSFFGKAYSEPTLIGMAYAYEKVSNKRVLPEFNPSFLD
ncbi:MAG: amidase [Chitinophagaceae bacterium]|nr:amidase [Chitinophagaceae bacterium]